MSDIIHLLPDSVANQIAAGEVIQRPASVLKELVENSLDAGATSIKIIIKDAGRTLIQIIDNGKGMSETDARMSFERHATSKIKTADDLFSLNTMGFRGEALASIAAVAQVELKTRRKDDELGVYIEIAGTKVLKQEPTHCDIGTNFTIKNLFFNIPARRRFLKTDATEKNHILTEFYRIALVNPNIEFQFFDGDDEIFNLSSSNHRVRISNIFGKLKSKAWQQQWLTIETSTSIISIYGYIGKPEFAQKNAFQYFFVNGRYMRHPFFHKAVTVAYNQLIQSSDSPNYFIYLEVDPQTIDVNIHPTKTEIKFENEHAIWAILSSAVKEALGKFNIVPSIDFDQTDSITMPTLNSNSNIEPPKHSFNPSYNPFKTNTNSYQHTQRVTTDWEKLYQDFDNQEIKKSDSPSFDSSLNISPITELDIPNSLIDIEQNENMVNSHLQFKRQYILTSIKSGLLIIDQNKAHIRILFDQFIIQLNNQRGNSQQLLFPEELILGEEELSIFGTIKDELCSIGFDFEMVNPKRYLIKGIPAQLNANNVLRILDDLISKATTINLDIKTELYETIALTMAKNTAIKNGQNLTNIEMTDLIDKLFASSNCNYTPDGNLIMSIYTQEEIEKKFVK